MKDQNTNTDALAVGLMTDDVHVVDLGTDTDTGKTEEEDHDHVADAPDHMVDVTDIGADLTVDLAAAIDTGIEGTNDHLLAITDLQDHPVVHTATNHIVPDTQGDLEVVAVDHIPLT